MKVARKLTRIVWMMAAMATVATPAYASTGGTFNDLLAKLDSVIGIILPIIIFAAVVRVMWEGIKMAIGSDAGKKSFIDGSAGDPKAALIGTVKGLLWVLGASIVVKVAVELAQGVIGKF